MLHLRIKSALGAVATMAAIGFAGCSGERSVLPGVAPQKVASWHSSRAGRFTPLTSQPPSPIQLEWLMTDGSILAENYSAGNLFYRYVPDAKGNYLNGTWTRRASLPPGYGPIAAASDVLINGSFALVGGEYNEGSSPYQLQLTNLGAVYDPVKDTWTALGHPHG